jgi:cardiolipin synthase
MRQPARALVLTLPNAITLARLCAVPLAVWLMVQHRFQAAFWLFVAAGISDAIDGVLARRTGSQSALGATLDPVADKALLVSVYVTLGLMGRLPDWLVILVVFRDLMIVGGVLILYLLGSPPVMAPLMVSKVNTAAQIVLAALALGLAGFGVEAPMLLEAAVIVVAATTLLSGAAYLRRWVHDAAG